MWWMYQQTKKQTLIIVQQVENMSRTEFFMKFDVCFAFETRHLHF